VLSVAGIVSLALGIGMNSAMFAIAHAVIFRPLPFHEPEGLVAIWATRHPRRSLQPGRPEIWTVLS
jgi:hypothetical protein